MGLSPLGLGIDGVRAVQLVFPVRDLLDHRPRRLAVGSRSIRLQIGIGRLEPVQPVFDMALQDVRVSVSQLFDL